MKIGIYGGTFNPPHLGHLTAAAAVIATLKLDKLLLIPASIPPHKDLPAGSATAEQRLEMTRMAGEQLGLGSKVETLDMEVRRAGKSFTSDTLAELKAQFPEDELWLLMGTDMFLSFETWHEPEKIASLAGIAAFGRTKADMEPQFSAQRDKLYRLYPEARIFTLTVPGVIDISSTELRERLASGTGENLLPPAVYGYILRNHLYGADVNLKSLTLSQLRPVALSYLKYKRIPHVLGTEQEAIRLAIRYGADVINRIIEQGKPGGRKKLQDAILKETLVPLLQTLCKDAKLPPARIVRLCVASNTTMNHLFVGVDADPVRMEPYIPAFFHWDGLRVHDLGLPAHPDAAIRLAPNIGSYVGGDITAGTFASMLWDRDELSLFIDLGTNGEIVFGNRDFMVSCACSAGPAFEGGDISCGMRATDGAIESCVIDPETMEPTFGIIGEPGQKPVGLCGSGIIDTIAELFHAGILNSKGIFVREGKRVAHDRHGCGRYILATPEESATGREVALNEVDIDNFIRAKGAIYSAIDTLLAAMDMDESVIESFYVAGGIGSGINMRNAVRIGMFPNVPLELFHYIGNSSLAGAYTMALSDEANDRVEQVARNMTYMELSTHPGYMDAFVAACFLPHTDAARFASAE